MANENGITLNGPIFGLFATITVLAVITAIVVGAVLTKGALLAVTLALGLVAVGLFLASIVICQFYNWAARGFTGGYEHDVAFERKHGRYPNVWGF